VPGRFELSSLSGVSCEAMADFASGGSSTGDSAFVAIAHSEVRDGRSVAVRDVVRKVRPPFSSEQVCADFAVLLRSYRISTMAANRWARRFPAEQMRKHGTDKRHSERNKSEIYRDVLAAINSGRCELLDHPRPITQERSNVGWTTYSPHGGDGRGRGRITATLSTTRGKPLNCSCRPECGPYVSERRACRGRRSSRRIREPRVRC
jgi:hypothetical protein